MKVNISEKVPKNRPAFHVDEKLKEASKRAAKAFEQEENDLEKYNKKQYNL